MKEMDMTEQAYKNGHREGRKAGFCEGFRAGIEYASGKLTEISGICLGVSKVIYDDILETEAKEGVRDAGS